MQLKFVSFEEILKKMQLLLDTWALKQDMSENAHNPN